MGKITIPELKIAQNKGRLILKEKKSKIASIRLDNTKDIIKTLRKIIPKKAIPVQEHSAAILLDMNYIPLGFIRLGLGALEEVSFEPRNCWAQRGTLRVIYFHSNPHPWVNRWILQ